MRNFIVFTPHECDQTKEEMDGTSNRYEGRKMRTGFWSVKRKRTLGRHKSRWEGSNETLVKESEWEGLSGFDLAQDRDKRPDAVDRLMPIGYP